MDELKNICCHPDCTAPAEWAIVYGTRPDAYTEACTAHVGELLGDDPMYEVYPIKQ